MADTVAPPPAPAPSDASAAGANGRGYDRVPPHSLEAEVSVLGAALLSRNAASEVVEILRPDDFYRTAHRVVFEGLRELMTRGEPIDAVTLLDWLARHDRLAEVGGAPAIHGLTAAVPTAANAVHYAKIVRERALLRRLIEAGTSVARMGYEPTDDAAAVVDKAEALIYEVAETGTTSDYSELKDLLNTSFEHIEKLAENRSEVTGLATGFNDFDRLTAGLQPQNLVIVAARPSMGKSSLALGMAQYVAVELRSPVLLFSLEMSKLELVNRLLSSEARIDAQRIKTGRLEDTDWRELGDALGRLSDAPLFIDDTPSITLMEIRAKCRRLKQRRGLDLVIVDYLQLMQSHRRVDNRQQEVAEISRGLKMLAKELDVPVIALSQLSRQPEARTDKRPQLADLRESGCLTRDTRLFRADTGLPVTFGELLDTEARDVPVWSVDESGRLVPGRLTHAFATGTKEVFRVRLASGASLEATANHPFLTWRGWRPLGELGIDSGVATVRRLPEPVAPTPMDPDELVSLAHVINDGTAVARQPIEQFTRGRGCWDPHQKRLPTAVFALPSEQVAFFLHHLWATDGCVSLTTDARGRPCVGLYYATASSDLAQDVRMLLLRLGISSRLRSLPSRPHARASTQVWVDGDAQQRRFCDLIGCRGAHGEVAAAPAAAVSARRSITASCTRALDRSGMSRVRAGRVAVLEDERPTVAAIDDVLWDRIVAIESLGEQPVFDATVAGVHNFVAEGVILHNSIEQDADLVGFIYRDEVYDENTQDRGIAELIVSKHRNGATGTVKLAFLNHLTKFANLARGGLGPPAG